MKTFWLFMCIFLIYHDLASFALTAGKIGNVERKHGNDAKAELRIKAIKEHTFEDEYEDCDDWEVFDGENCICARPEEAKCTEKGGMVCDNKGRKYKSICHFALEMCEEHLPLDDKIASCGLCKVLRLVDETREIEGKFDEFILQDSNGSQPLLYSSTTAGMSVFFEEHLKKWVIGVKSNNETKVSLVQEVFAQYPQDSPPGMFVATPVGDNVKWVLKPSLRLQCSSDVSKPPTKGKRFIFSLIIGLTVAAVAITATTTTLKVVQAAKGCLYYPSVCKLRDELKNRLGPEVKNLRDEFNRKYGNVTKYKAAVESIMEVIGNLRDDLMTIRKLQITFKDKLEQLTNFTADLIEEFPSVKVELEMYKNWRDGVVEATIWSTVGLTVEVALSVVAVQSLMTATVGLASLAAAGIAVVFAIGFAVVDIISSVNQEKQVRNELLQNKNRLLKARRELRSASRKMKEVQILICRSPIDVLRNLSRKGEKYHDNFRFLFRFLSNTYGDSSKLCNSAKYYSKSDFKTLRTLNNSYLAPVVNLIVKKKEELKRQINDIEELEIFLKEIGRKVKQDAIEPFELYKFLQKNKSSLVLKLFKTYHRFLAYIANKVLPNRSCYWGRNLDLLRSKELNERTYLQNPICDSPEINAYTDRIIIQVKKNASPCFIARLVEGDLFDSRYLVVKFIAEYVLPNETCYWGYNLEDLRRNVNNDELEKASLSSGLFSMLQLLSYGFKTFHKLAQTRKMLCSQFFVCGTKWQNFLMCAVWKDSFIPFVKCRRDGYGKRCVPPSTVYQKC